MVAPRYLRSLALMALSLTGCTSFQDMHYSLTNKSRAEFAWYSRTTLSQRWNCGSDYAYGYKKGYTDASTGGGCVLPAVPPPCYWATKYQCCEGQKHIQDWYRGYQCGVTAAQGDGYPSFHTVPLGPQAPVINKDGCGMCYAPAGCLAESTSEEVQSDTEYAVNTTPRPEDLTQSPQENAFQMGLIGPAGIVNAPLTNHGIRAASAERAFTQSTSTR